MGPIIMLKGLIWVSLLGGVSLALPSANDGLDLSAVLPLNGVLGPRSEPLEVRGIYGGRKKRYIVERAAPTCCINNLKCNATVGEYLDNKCKCTKCKSGKFPTADGRSCTDKCPDGGKPNGKDGCCKGDRCEQNDDDTDRRGKCPKGQVLDPREGLQTSQTPNPRCTLDDSKKCPKGQVPKTRFDGQELDEDVEVECAPLRGEKNKCPKGRFPEVNIYSDYMLENPVDYAEASCVLTRRFYKSKEDKTKNKDFRKRQKEEWNKREPQRRADKEALEKARESNRKEREDYRKKMDEIHKKLTDINDRKKARMGKCAPIAAMMYGFAESDPDKEEEGENEESPYDWTTDYFDEDFIDSAVFLNYWPDDMNIDDVKEVTDEGVDADQWMDKWEILVSQREYKESGHGGCLKRSIDIDRRCIAKRSQGHYDDFDDVHIFRGNDTVLERYVAAEEQTMSTRTDLMIRDPNYYVKRNPVAVVAQIIFFALRLGASLLTRTASMIARYTPRLARLMKTPDRLFKVAPRGSGTPRGIEGMKNAMSNIIKNPSFRQCLLEGVP